MQLRDYLRGLNGVGPKTAAWIARNVTGSTEFAIIDIWLIRALMRIGVFRPEWRVERHYDRFEAAFLQYAAHGNVLAGRPRPLHLGTGPYGRPYVVRCRLA